MLHQKMVVSKVDGVSVPIGVVCTLAPATVLAQNMIFEPSTQQRAASDRSRGHQRERGR